MLKKLISIFIINSFLFIYVVSADDVVEIVQEKTVDAKMTDQARQKILDEIVNDSTMKYIFEFIGQKKYERNKSVIQNKIIKNSGKYILSMKVTQPVKTASGYTTTGTIRFSVKNFQTLLLQEGLLYKFEGSPRILPLLSFEDRVSGERSAWWTEDIEGNGFMNSLSLDFMNSLRTEMWPKGFYSYIPKAPLSSSLIPKSFVIDNPRTDDLMFLGDFFEAQIVLKGFVRISKSKTREDSFHIDIHITGIHSGNGRVVGEVIRSYETESGPFQPVVHRRSREIFSNIGNDITVQIYDAWKRGTFGANLIRLTVNGDLTYQKLTSLKSQITERIRDIRAIKERLFGHDQVVFEVDSSSSSRQLATLIEGEPFKNISVKVSRISSDGLEIDVK